MYSLWYLCSDYFPFVFLFYPGFPKECPWAYFLVKICFKPPSSVRFYSLPLDVQVAWRLLSQFREFTFLPLDQPETSSLEVPSSSPPEGAVWGMQTVCQTTKDACDFIFKLGFLEVAPGPELLIVQLVLGQRLCLNPLCQWGFHPVSMDLCAAWGMTSKWPQLVLWLLLSRCLVHGHNLPDPQSWLSFQEGYSLLFLWSSLKLPALLLSHLLLPASWSYQTLLIVLHQDHGCFNNTLRPRILQTLFQM